MVIVNIYTTSANILKFAYPQAHKSTKNTNQITTGYDISVTTMQNKNSKMNDPMIHK